MTTRDELRKRISHLTTADLDRARQLWADIGRETDGIKLLAALLDELEQYKADAERYRWLREQPNDTSAPRIDVVHWTSNDESSNQGEGLRLNELDAAIDAAIATAEGKV